MKLYHGTDLVIDQPRVLVPNRRLDFGPSLYLNMQAEDKELFAPLALGLIKPENLVDQYVMKTSRAIAALELLEVVTDA